MCLNYKSIQSALMSVVASFCLGACTLSAGVGDKKVEGNIGGDGNTTTKTLSYDFEYNGCKTGKHEFHSDDDLCNGLRDSSLNHGCATEMRKSEFTKSCGSRVWGAYIATDKSENEDSLIQTESGELVLESNGL